jgi:hypothetical protein
VAWQLEWEGQRKLNHSGFQKSAMKNEPLGPDGFMALVNNRFA